MLAGHQSGWCMRPSSSREAPRGSDSQSGFGVPHSVLVWLWNLNLCAACFISLASPFYCEVADGAPRQLRLGLGAQPMSGPHRHIRGSAMHRGCWQWLLAWQRLHFATVPKTKLEGLESSHQNDNPKE